MHRIVATAFAMILATTSIAATLGDDGLHKAPWMMDTFKDLREDLAEAEAEGKRLMVLIEQRGCIYCTKMHEDVWPDPDIEALLTDRFFVVQINMFGDIDVTDFDGTTLPEKEMVQRWSALFTPTAMFFPPSITDISEDAMAPQAAVATMPGAFGKWTTFNMLSWVLEEGNKGDEPFQKYHARRYLEQKDQE